MTELNYNSIDLPYNNFLEREGSEFGLTINSSNINNNSGGGSISGGAIVENPSDIEKGSVEGQAFNNLWIDNWIKSRGYQPKKLGFYLDARTGYAEFANIFITGTITGATITGSTITGSTITGGTFQTASSGQRIVLAASDNTLRFFDATAESISIGTAGGQAIKITGNATTNSGINMASSVAGTGFSYTNSGNVTSRGLYIEMSSTNAANNLSPIEIQQSGSGDGILLNLIGSSRGLRVQRSVGSGTGNLVSLSSTNSSNSTILSILKTTTAGTGIDIDLSTTNNVATTGIIMNITAGGAAYCYAFRFNGSEINAAAVGGTQDKKIRVSIAGTDYYIPLYTT